MSTKFDTPTSQKAIHAPVVAMPLKANPSPASPVAKQRTISYWRLGEQITGGNWFDIYRAAPKSMLDVDSYDYVIKLINPHLSGERANFALDRLGREAISTDLIEHHGVIPLLDAELDRSPFFVVQPWIAGGSLDKFMAVAEDISLIRMLWVIRQVAEAIDAAHEHGRVHLGLEPAHVLLGNGGRISMLGWSQSHAIGQVVNLPNDRMQSVQYTAPECFDEGVKGMPASDVYSLGAFIYHVLVGRSPFKGTNIAELVEAHRQQEPIDIIRHQPVCPARLSQLVSRMLCKTPALRPKLGEVLEQLISIEIENLDNPGLIAL